MAKVTWSAGIDSVSGALAKPSKGGQHSCEKMLLGTHRVAPTMSNDCNRLYLRKQTKRTTPVTADEILIRNRFTAISKAIKTRRHDLTKIAADQAAYMAQRNDPNGKRSMQAWYWMVEGEAYDQAHS